MRELRGLYPDKTPEQNGELHCTPGQPVRSEPTVSDNDAQLARIEVAAAAIMVAVAAGFALDPSVIVKIIGVGLASAILIDVTVVRMLVVPAAMVLLGDANWWLPRWLDRLLPGPARRASPRPAPTAVTVAG